MIAVSAARTLTARSCLTSGRASFRGTLVRSALSILTALILLVTLAIGPTARASVPVPCGAATTSGVDAHFEGDADEVPADDDAAFPHHHGTSHDHQVGTAFEDSDMVAAVVPNAPHWARTSASQVSAGSDPALRPPRA